MTEQEEHFTIFIRLPFERGSFVDPPPVAWSATKERELWEIISKSSKGHDIDWRGLAERFNVTQAFLLQQAAWLYERQLSQVRAQMRKMGNRSSNTPSPLPQSNNASIVGAQPMKRTGSGGSRVPSRLSTQVAPGDASVPETPSTPAKGRSSFANRPASQALAPTPRPKPDPVASRIPPARTSRDVEPSSRTHSRRGSVQHQLTRSPKQLNLPDPESSSDEEDMTQSRMLQHRRPNPAAARRTLPPRKAQHTRRPSAPHLDEDDDDGDSPAFLPFSNQSAGTTRDETAIYPRDSTSTFRASQRPLPQRKSTSERIVPTTTTAKTSSQTAKTTTDSVLSHRPVAERRQERQLQSQQRADPSDPAGRGNLPHPLSPHQQAALATAAGLSPRLRRNPGTGSDTSPSMGSSFSDLDDASVTQSALEEALLSGMGNTTMTVGGNVANRVSGISQALRSRYLDARGDAQPR